VRLQTKLTVAFAAVTLVPMVALAVIARVVVGNVYRAQLAQELEQAVARVDDEFRRLQSDVESAAARLASTGERPLRGWMLALAKGPLDDDTARDIAAQAPGEMRSLGLDVLALVDVRGEIVAAGHFAGRVGDSDSDALARARSSPGRALLVHEQIFQGGRAQPMLALEAAREVVMPLADSSGAAHVRAVVIGGRVVGESFAARLPAGARLYDADGKLVAAQSSKPPPKSWPRRTVELVGSDGQAVARVEVAVSDSDLEETLALIGELAAAFIVAALLLSLLVGAALARRIAGPLHELADGARAVSRGTLDATVEVRTRDEVGELAATFNTMTRDLAGARQELVRAERVAAWREIAQRIAHEIKNPLTPIQMAVETLKRAHDKGAPQFDALFAESADTILDEVTRLKHIVAEFSSFARMPQPALAPVDVNALVDGALALYKGGETRLQLALAPDLPPALADRDQLTQVLINLVENARDAVAGAGTITVTTRAAAGRVELEVADDGPGLSDEARARLFTPYFTTKARGTGLGLAIVHRIVGDHGGEIRVASNDNRRGGKGAVFTVAVPVATT
jgi:two-component system, NtrC family, nitrogen regulation sensor histidine kinase NtrY